MKILIVTILVFGSNCLEDLKTEFELASIDAPKELSKERVYCVFNEKINEEMTPSIMALHMFEKEKSCTFLVEYYRAWGGHYSYYMLHTVDNKGTLLMSEVISKTELDEEGGFVTELKIVEDSLLEVALQYLKLDENGKELPGRREFQYYLINEYGFQFIPNKSNKSSRSFDASSRLLSFDELIDFDVEDLDVMRNEIFADHGYIFKTEKWREYFAKQPWYEPNFEDVNDKLSIVEKINVRTILEVRKTK